MKDTIVVVIISEVGHLDLIPFLNLDHRHFFYIDLLTKRAHFLSSSLHAASITFNNHLFGFC